MYVCMCMYVFVYVYVCICNCMYVCIRCGASSDEVHHRQADIQAGRQAEMQTELSGLGWCSRWLHLYPCMHVRARLPDSQGGGRGGGEQEGRKEGESGGTRVWAWTVGVIARIIAPLGSPRDEYKAREPDMGLDMPGLSWFCTVCTWFSTDSKYVVST